MQATVAEVSLKYSSQKSYDEMPTITSPDEAAEFFRGIFDPSEDISDHPELRRFKETMLFAKQFEIGTYCLHGEKGPQVKLLSISNNDGVFHQIARKQHLLNTLEGLNSPTLAQYSALITIITRKEGIFDRNPMAKEDSILAELTSQTFGWLLWSWQIMGLVSYYLPTFEPNTFIIIFMKRIKGHGSYLQKLKQILGKHYTN